MSDQNPFPIKDREFPRIVVLDGYTLCPAPGSDPQEPDWLALARLGELQVFDRTAPQQVLARSAGARALLTNKTVLDEATLAKLPDLRYVGVLATGYNVVDVAAAARRNILVSNIPSYGTASVAQMVFAHLLELTQHVGRHAQGVRQGRWSRNPDWCYWEAPLVELEGLTLGIVGLGRIGRTVARIGRAFGMTILAYDAQPPAAELEGVRMAGLDELFAQSDVISLHCPLTPQTQGLVNAQRLGQMKPTAFLINTSRGPLVNEADLAEALNRGQIAGAGLDVLAVEPPEASSPLLAAHNCQITPHIAWATRAARKRLMSMAVENLRAFLIGKPINLVNPPAGLHVAR